MATRAIRNLLISNGILTADGRLNMTTAESLSWKLKESEEERPDMNEIEYEVFLSFDMEDKLRVRALKDKGEILEFVVQYEAFLGGKWHPIIRYDTAHGFAHIDVMSPDGRVDKQPIYFPSYRLAFTYATQDLKKHWMEYRQRYERRMKK